MTTSNFRLNILAAQISKRIVRSLLFPYSLQFLALIVFIVLVINGVLTGTAESFGNDLTPMIRKTNITTLVVWGVWWPGLILTTILLGRIWCTVCPMEFVSNIAHRTAGFFGIAGIRLPVWIRKGYIILLSYIILQLLVAGFQVHRTPLYSSYVLLGLLSLALFIGFLFKEPRAFCKGFCPASLLLDTYSRLSPFTLMKDTDYVCTHCDTKDCIRPENRDNLDARSCPSYLRPFDLQKHDTCVICFQCAKVCPHDNIGFGVSKSALQQKIIQALPLANAIFIFIASGFVSHELFAETPLLDDIFHATPGWLAEQYRTATLFPWFEALWFLLGLPTIIFSLVWLINRLSMHRYSVVEFITRIGLYLIPVLAAGHAIKAIIKLNSWSVYIPLALSDPQGIRTAKSIVAGNLQAVLPFLPAFLVFSIAAILLMSSIVIGRKIIQERIETSLRFSAYAGLGILACLYFVVILNLIPK